MSEEKININGTEYDIRDILSGVSLLYRVSQLQKSLGKEAIITLFITDKNIYTVRAELLSKKELSEILDTINVQEETGPVTPLSYFG